ncbi:MAG: paraquat-inducible protein A [Burkholderiales bacterium]|jgi:paraquat-inducible protein A|nr:paraquat-inducible protein A [Burkholderiales bacterium]
MSAVALTAAQAGLVSCETCRLLARPAHADHPGFCPRCGEQLEFRRAGSLQYTWALVIAAAICYVPANLLPVMETTAFGSTEADTIMGGVVFLYESGSWPLALIVLVASVMVPVGKLIALAYLLFVAQRGVPGGNRDRTRLYRAVVFIGRWSMLDVFVDTFTVALVQLSPLMSVAPGPGVLFFAAVVVLTMLAADSFDPRLIWDSASDEEPQRA